MLILTRNVTEDHPRVGGEKRATRNIRLNRWGSPPRGRGKDHISKDTDLDGRITPAWAGKSPYFGSIYLGNEDHPRVGGEKISFFFTGCSPKGSPPRGRGKAEPFQSLLVTMGITPAWAGKSFFQCFD